MDAKLYFLTWCKTYRQLLGAVQRHHQYGGWQIIIGPRLRSLLLVESLRLNENRMNSKSGWYTETWTHKPRQGTQSRITRLRSSFRQRKKGRGVFPKSTERKTANGSEILWNKTKENKIQTDISWEKIWIWEGICTSRAKIARNTYFLPLAWKRKQRSQSWNNTGCWAFHINEGQVLAGALCEFSRNNFNGKKFTRFVRLRF